MADGARVNGLIHRALRWLIGVVLARCMFGASLLETLLVEHEILSAAELFLKRSLVAGVVE